MSRISDAQSDDAEELQSKLQALNRFVETVSSSHFIFSAFESPAFEKFVWAREASSPPRWGSEHFMGD